MCRAHSVSGESGNGSEFHAAKVDSVLTSLCLCSSDAVQCLPSLLLGLPLPPALCDSSTLIDCLNPAYIPTRLPLIYFFTV